MRDDDVVNIDNGPNVKKMYRMAVSYLADRECVPMNVIYQRALDLLVESLDWTSQELADYYGLRAKDLDVAMSEMKRRGIAAKKANKRPTDARRRAA